MGAPPSALCTPAAPSKCPSSSLLPRLIPGCSMTPTARPSGAPSSACARGGAVTSRVSPRGVKLLPTRTHTDDALTRMTNTNGSGRRGGSVRARWLRGGGRSGPPRDPRRVRVRAVGDIDGASGSAERPSGDAVVAVVVTAPSCPHCRRAKAVRAYTCVHSCAREGPPRRPTNQSTFADEPDEPDETKGLDDEPNERRDEDASI